MSDPVARARWERVWSTRSERDLSWFLEEPALSLELISAYASPGASVLDVGGGASRLGDRLNDRGYRVGVLDAAAPALELSKRRLGERADEIEWLVADVLTFQPPHPWDVSHDRTVFHFLTQRPARAAYAVLRHS